MIASETATEVDRPDLKEYEKNYLCATCSVGCDDIQEFMDHINGDEHNFHKKRNLARLVPGLGFCGACYTLMQSELNWKSHIIGVKHKKCVGSLEAAEGLGAPKQSNQYIYPLGCKIPGVLGGTIASSDISFKMANNYNFGHGGAIASGTPLVGLGFIEYSTKTSNQFQDVYQCTLCDEQFGFSHRAKHLTGAGHRTKFLEQHYPERYTIVQSAKYRTLKLLYHCAMVEEDEKSKESKQAKNFRTKFLAIPKHGHKNLMPKVERPEAATRGSRGGGRGGGRGGERGGGRGSGRAGGRGGGRGSGRGESMVEYYNGPLLPMNAPTRRSRGGPAARGGLMRGRGVIDRPTMLPSHLGGGSSRGGPRGGPPGRAERGNFLNHSSRPEYYEPQYDDYQDEYRDPYASAGYQDPYAVSTVPHNPYAPDVSGYAPYPEDDPYNAYPRAKRQLPQKLLPPSKRPLLGAPESQYDDPHVSEAMAAISVLEKFAQSQAAADVKKRIAEMRASVINAETGDELDHLKGITDMAEQLKKGGQTSAPPATHAHAAGEGREVFGAGDMEVDQVPERYSSDFIKTDTTFNSTEAVAYPNKHLYQSQDPYSQGSQQQGYQGQQGHPRSQQSFPGNSWYAPRG